MEIPSEIQELISEALIAELSFIKKGKIISHPILPFYIKDENKIVFTSSILFSKKIEAMKINPKISLFFNHEAGIKNKKYFPVLIKGIARIDDSDVHNKWMKYLLYWEKKEPYIKKFFKQRYAFPLFWERIIVEIEPLKIYAWKENKIDEEPIIIENGR